MARAAKQRRSINKKTAHPKARGGIVLTVFS